MDEEMTNVADKEIIVLNFTSQSKHYKRMKTEVEPNTDKEIEKSQN